MVSYLCNLIIFVSLLVFSIAKSVHVPTTYNPCHQLIRSARFYCESYSRASGNLDEYTSTCCYNLRMYKCLQEQHNATCPPPSGSKRFLATNVDCSQFTDFSKCNSLLDGLSSASITFVIFSIMTTILCVCGCICCRLFARNDSRDLIETCQLTAFKVPPSKIDLKGSSSISISTPSREESCSVSMDTNDESKLSGKDSTISLPQPIHQPLVNISGDFLSPQPDDN